ncbi:hypothetical protein AT236_01139 [Lactobacillus delbrueckii subsp. bulgaricus]|nr:hypothetical protein AT236_01139 [Lactobacillus delbrueckii subsp. bulgaricus]
MPNGKDVYVDFFYTDEDLTGNDEMPTVADFDQKVVEEYSMFLRKKNAGTFVAQDPEKAATCNLI